MNNICIFEIKSNNNNVDEAHRMVQTKNQNESETKNRNIASGECLRTLEGHTDNVYSLAISSEGYLCRSRGEQYEKIWMDRPGCGGGGGGGA